MDQSKWTDRLRHIYQLAKQEAWRLGHREVLPLHLVVGCLKEGRGYAAQAFGNAGMSLKAARDALTAAVPCADAHLDKVPPSQATLCVVGIAKDVSAMWKNNFIGDEHLVYALACDQSVHGALWDIGSSGQVLQTAVRRGVSDGPVPEPFDKSKVVSLPLDKVKVAKFTHDICETVGAATIDAILSKSEKAPPADGGEPTNEERVKSFAKTAFSGNIVKYDSTIRLPFDVPANLTDRSRRVLQFAVDEAKRLRHVTLCPAHILYGLAKETGGIGHHVLKQHDIDAQKVRGELEKWLFATVDGTAHFTPHAGADFLMVVGAAGDEAASIDHTVAGPEHLLLALCDYPSEAKTMLGNFGVRPRDVRDEVLALLGVPAAEEDEAENAPTPEAAPSSSDWLEFGKGGVTFLWDKQGGRRFFLGDADCLKLYDFLGAHYDEIVKREYQRSSRELKGVEEKWLKLRKRQEERE